MTTTIEDRAPAYWPRDVFEEYVLTLTIEDVDPYDIASHLIDLDVSRHAITHDEIELAASEYIADVERIVRDAGGR